MLALAVGWLCCFHAFHGPVTGLDLLWHFSHLELRVVQASVSTAWGSCCPQLRTEPH